jgi:hypothetical protein
LLEQVEDFDDHEHKLSKLIDDQARPDEIRISLYGLQSNERHQANEDIKQLLFFEKGHCLSFECSVNHGSQVVHIFNFTRKVFYDLGEKSSLFILTHLLVMAEICLVLDSVKFSQVNIKIEESIVDYKCLR